MGSMYRIICKQLLILIRLVIIVSLAGYSLSTAAAAMHGRASDAPMVMSESMEYAGAQMSEHDHHDQVSADEDSSKVVKQECCKDFCVSIAIIANIDTWNGPVVSSIHAFMNDSDVIGELVPLHRPPNI
ncbi:hypothetical protein RMS29_027200 (plasmid) [Agrobacterium rosae]|jgi:hypothetical protein|uniref:Uncharacterized protein n=3 Tax=Rhizobium/Agrobacterium group TaxID=227290 RepID=B9K622_ALLAM|nr:MULTISPECIES: hypothetical protein [Rhizobium/Agrobacterium group]ACM40320.1 conserved hypothetical protein [Allorhizobium ampelinum S4]MDX8332084.1 hypothetical protein [Agrobacterium rosae]WCJ66098.1 hypothetical protein G6M15_25095 [Agrobacterium tumefaciens]WCK17154.1 hypothetical protein G6L41_026750 [Agrobacterium tumefaciens]